VFTLFDFDTFYMAIDALLEFINSDFTCYTMDAAKDVLNCNALQMPEPTSSDGRLMSPRATSCWADAQQGQVGVSTLYSCSATSTCCADPLSCDDPSKNMMCGDCPLPAQGIRTFGCNTMIQKCQCGLESYEVDRCVAQRECGPSSSCSLLTGLDDVSFGSLKSCSGCASSPICLVGGSQHYGECTCLSSPDAKVALCDSGAGARVSPDASKLCGYSVESQLRGHAPVSSHSKDTIVGITYVGWILFVGIWSILLWSFSKQFGSQKITQKLFFS
jgi:hypothetical protein